MVTSAKVSFHLGVQLSGVRKEESLQVSRASGRRTISTSRAINRASFVKKASTGMIESIISRTESISLPGGHANGVG